MDSPDGVVRFANCGQFAARMKLPAKHPCGLDRAGQSSFPMFYVYVLHSELDHGLYIGFSADLRSTNRRAAVFNTD
jgi:hypothetical protein